MPATMPATILSTTGVPTDPEGTLRPDEDALAGESHTLKPVSVEELLYKLHLPTGINPDNAYGIFSLFFINDILATIAYDTNTFAVIQEAKLQADHPDRTTPKLPWMNTSTCEWKAYLGFLIYRSTYPIACRDDCWTTNLDMPLHRNVYVAIGRNRFDELEASLHLSDPITGGDMFAKVCIESFAM